MGNYRVGIWRDRRKEFLKSGYVSILNYKFTAQIPRHIPEGATLSAGDRCLADYPRNAENTLTPSIATRPIGFITSTTTMW